MADSPPGTTVIYGAREQAIIGDSMAVGDIHGDGYADMFVGVPGDEGPLDRFFSGGIAIIAGGPDLPAEIDLWAPQVPVVWVQAPEPLDFAAYWSASGDLDGDGRIDAIPNGMAGDGPANRRDNTGEAHVVSGLALAQYLPGEAVTAVGEAAVVPGGAQLYPAYPNPFNASVRIPYSLAHSGRYALDIYTVGRQRIRRLAGGESRAGHYEAVWDGRDAVGGKWRLDYMLRLAIGAEYETKRLTLVK